MHVNRHSAVDQMKMKYPSSQVPRFNPHAQQQKISARLEQIKKDMMQLGFAENPYLNENIGQEE